MDLIYGNALVKRATCIRIAEANRESFSRGIQSRSVIQQSYRGIKLQSLLFMIKKQISLRTVCDSLIPLPSFPPPCLSSLIVTPTNPTPFPSCLLRTTSMRFSCTEPDCVPQVDIDITDIDSSRSRVCVQNVGMIKTKLKRGSKRACT